MDIKTISDNKMHLIREAYQFFIDYLGIRWWDEAKILSVRMARENELNEGVYGNCLVSHNRKTNSVQKIQILIEDIPSAYGIIECLAHELVHAKQSIDGKVSFKVKPVYLLGIFKIGYRQIALFNGQPTKHLPYFERPEELEAFEKQTGMVEAFMMNRTKEWMDAQKRLVESD